MAGCSVIRADQLVQSVVSREGVGNWSRYQGGQPCCFGLQEVAAYRLLLSGTVFGMDHVDL